MKLNDTSWTTDYLPHPHPPYFFRGVSTSENYLRIYLDRSLFQTYVNARVETDYSKYFEYCDDK